MCRRRHSLCDRWRWISWRASRVWHRSRSASHCGRNRRRPRHLPTRFWPIALPAAHLVMRLQVEIVSRSSRCSHLLVSRQPNFRAIALRRLLRSRRMASSLTRCSRLITRLQIPCASSLELSWSRFLDSLRVRRRRVDGTPIPSCLQPSVRRPPTTCSLMLRSARTRRRRRISL